MSFARLLRLEFDSSYLGYYTELDGVQLLGTLPEEDDVEGSSVDPPCLGDHCEGPREQKATAESAEQSVQSRACSEGANSTELAENLACLSLEDEPKHASCNSWSGAFEKIPVSWNVQKDLILGVRL